MLCNFDNFYLFLVILSLNKSRERWNRCFFFAKRCYKAKSVICFWFPWHCLSTGSNNNSVLCFFLKKTFNLVFFLIFPLKIIWNVMFCRSLFVLLSLFYHCIACTSSIYGFWLPLWYLQTCKSRIEKLFKKQHEWNWWNTNRICVFKFVNRSKYYFFYIYSFIDFHETISFIPPC
jgi:hypothetical protein